MQITGTHFNYYLVCQRKLWLFANSIHMEHTSDLVYQGKTIHESVYPNRSDKYKEIELDGIKIDYFDKRNKVIHEIKKSHKEHESHIWQLKYYIYIMEKAGVNNVTGLLEYPKERKTEEVYLNIPDRQTINEILVKMDQLINSKTCPTVINQPKCNKCSYYDFCYAGETDEL
nr:CRISPR-associated protein Cas4 [uncultured Carboxylicivirga sp.]